MTIKKFKGFTLIEILVATGIFVSVMVVLSQVYLAVIRSERVAYGLLSAENNLRNNLEIIARSLRMGKNVKLVDNGNGICFDYFLDNQWKEVCYRYNGTNYNIEQQIGKDNNYEPLFDPNLKIIKANFYIQGDSSQKSSQMTIVIPLEVETPPIKNQVYTFHLQTAVTPRIFTAE